MPVPQRDPLTAVGTGGFAGLDKTTGLVVKVVIQEAPFLTLIV